MSTKFAAIAIGEFFFLNHTPAPSATDPKPKAVIVSCKKASSVTYVDLAQAYLGEVSYSPLIEDKVMTSAEYAAFTAPEPAKPAKKQVKKAEPVSKKTPPAKKAPAKKSAPKKKPVKGAPAKKAEKATIPQKKKAKKKK